MTTASGKRSRHRYETDEERKTRGPDTKARHRRSYKEIIAEEGGRFSTCPFDGCGKRYYGKCGHTNLVYHIRKIHGRKAALTYAEARRKTLSEVAKMAVQHIETSSVQEATTSLAHSPDRDTDNQPSLNIGECKVSKLGCTQDGTLSISALPNHAASGGPLPMGHNGFYLSNSNNNSSFDVSTFPHASIFQGGFHDNSNALRTVISGSGALGAYPYIHGHQSMQSGHPHLISLQHGSSSFPFPPRAEQEAFRCNNAGGRLSNESFSEHATCLNYLEPSTPLVRDSSNPGSSSKGFVALKTGRDLGVEAPRTNSSNRPYGAQMDQCNTQYHSRLELAEDVAGTSKSKLPYEVPTLLPGYDPNTVVYQMESLSRGMSNEVPAYFSYGADSAMYLAPANSISSTSGNFAYMDKRSTRLPTGMHQGITETQRPSQKSAQDMISQIPSFLYFNNSVSDMSQIDPRTQFGFSRGL